MAELPRQAMPRLFVGIDLPHELKLTLSLLCTGLPRARWVDPGNFHLTLRFIGEVDEAMADRIAVALMRIEAARLMLTLAGVGHFGRHTLWAGVEENPSLTCLQGKIETALQQAGLPPETQQYFPHVKLARLRSLQKLRSFLDDNAPFRAEPFEVGHFSLIESHLTKRGAIYEDKVDYLLC